MSDVMRSLLRAGGNLFDPRILALLLLPVLGSFLLWSVLTWVFWDAWTGFVSGMLRSTVVAGWLQNWSVVWIIDYTAVLAVLIAVVPAMLVTALVITEIVAMPVIVRFVADGYYPGLGHAFGGSVAGSIANAVVAIVIFVLLWVVTLPLWLTGFGAVLAPLLTSAWLNQRLFRYDAMADHASREEFADFVRTSRGELFLLGILLSALLYVPVLNLAVPVLAGLAFTHFGLARLAVMRQSKLPLI